MDLIAHEGKIIGASFVKAPRQSNGKDKNKEKKKGKRQKSGMADPIRNAKKMWMPVGQKRTTRLIMDIKTMQRWIISISSSTPMQQRTPQYAVHRHWRAYIDRKGRTKTFGQIVPIRERSRKRRSKNTI